MTWHSQGGDRTLTGAEAALIREMLAYVVDMVDEDITASADPWEFGVAAFDCLEPPARLRSPMLARGTTMADSRGSERNVHPVTRGIDDKGVDHPRWLP